MGGFSLVELNAIGSSAAELRDVLFSAAEISAAGF